MGADWPIMETIGAWRSLVAHLYGVQGVAGSNPVAPIDRSMAPQSPLNGVLQGQVFRAPSLIFITDGTLVDRTS